MKSLVKKWPAFLGYFALPMLALAQIDAGGGDLGSVADDIVSFLNTYVIPLIFAIALVVFLWGLFKFLTAGGDEEKRKEGRNMIIWGVVILFVMTAVWGLVNLLGRTFGLGGDTLESGLPEVPF